MKSTHRVSIQFTPEEYRAIGDACRRHGIPAATLARAGLRAVVRELDGETAPRLAWAGRPNGGEVGS